MKNNNKDKGRMEKFEFGISEIENLVTRFQQQILSQSNEIEELRKVNDQTIDSIFKELLTVLDSFDKADNRLAELYSESEDVAKARKRFATSKRKLLELFKKYEVCEIQFPNGLATIDDCQISDTEPNAEKPNDTIVSIEKKGYRRNGRLLRLAEVVIVKN